MNKQTETAPERIWIDPNVKGEWDAEQCHCCVEYVRADTRTGSTSADVWDEAIKIAGTTMLNADEPLAVNRSKIVAALKAAKSASLATRELPADLCAICGRPESFDKHSEGEHMGQHDFKPVNTAGHLPAEDEKIAEIRERQEYRKATLRGKGGPYILASEMLPDIDYLLSALTAARDEIATLDAENEELNGRIQVLQNRAREPVAEMWRPTTDKPETPAQILIHVRGFTEFGAFNGQWHLFSDGDHYILEEHEVDGWLPIPPLPAGPQENQEDGQ